MTKMKTSKIKLLRIKSKTCIMLTNNYNTHVEMSM